MKLRIVMADPAGNRTAIVRSHVPAGLRSRAASAIMARKELRAEQVGFETAPCMGGEGRLEMMGGEFCGNAARSYGYLLWLDKERREASGSESCHSGNAGRGRIRIEISGSRHPLEVCCDTGSDSSYAQMPMPLRLEFSREGFPMVISEGITHMILEKTAPDEALAEQLIDRYGAGADALGIMFLEDGKLTPFVYVASAGSRVWESSCGSGSLAAAWYLERTGREADAAADPSEDSAAEILEQHIFRFQEPGGTLTVEICRSADGTITGRMGGAVTMETEIELELEL